MNANHIPNLTLAEYHARPEWSHSQIEVLHKSPPLFYGTYISKEFPRESTAALDDGTIVHEVLTGGKELEDVVAIIPNYALSVSGARRGAEWDAWSDAHRGKIQRKESELFAIRRMIASVRTHEKAAELLAAEGFFEHSIVWTDADTGLDLRCRPDKFCTGLCINADLKTTRFRTDRQFSAEILDQGYHRQLAWYADGLKALGFEVRESFFIAVEKTPAYECHVYKLCESAVELGREENRQLLTELQWRLKTGNWESRDAGATKEIDIPEYGYPEQELNWSDE